MMDPYLLIFIINLGIAFFANKSYDHGRRILSALLLVVLVATNTVFSGCRDFGVGIDTNVYIDSFFRSAQSLESVKDFLEFEGDKGFLLLAYLASLYSEDSQSLLIATELFIQAFLYLALWQYKKVENISIFVATALFCIMFYCHTLNLMRQFCAISMLAFAFSLFIQGKKKSYVALQVLAFFFHSTSVVFVFVPLMMEISKFENLKTRNTYLSLLVVLLLVFVSFYSYFLVLLGDFSVISETYADRYSMSGQYSRGETVTGGTGLGKLFAFCYPIAFIVYAIYRKIEGKSILYFMLTLTVSYSILQLLGYQVRFVDRIAFYLSFISFIYVSKIFSSSRANLVIKIFMFYMYFSKWYSIYIVSGGGDVYPYSSTILNIK